MSDDDDFSAKREDFRAQVREMEAIPAESDPDGHRYNALVEKLDSQVGEWTEMGIAKVILSPLLDDESAVMRGAAASYLLRTAENQKPIEVLTDLAGDPTHGQAYMDAGAALRIWRKENP